MKKYRVRVSYISYAINKDGEVKYMNRTVTEFELKNLKESEIFKIVFYERIA